MVSPRASVSTNWWMSLLRSRPSSHIQIRVEDGIAVRTCERLKHSRRGGRRLAPSLGPLELPQWLDQRMRHSIDHPPSLVEHDLPLIDAARPDALNLSAMATFRETVRAPNTSGRE